MQRRGFTLIELMIVIAIIAIIAAIAIPNLMDARRAANEGAAIAALRAIHSAQSVYREQDRDGNGTLDFAPNPGQLKTVGLLSLENPPSGSEDLATSGYTFMTGGEEPSPWSTMFKWSAVAEPEEEAAGSRVFFIDQTGVIRYTLAVDEANGDEKTIWPAVGK